MRLIAIRNGPKQTISASCRLELLQMILESDTERCVNEDAGTLRGVDCEIPHRLERRTKHPYKGVENLSITDVF